MAYAAAAIAGISEYLIGFIKINGNFAFFAFLFKPLYLFNIQTSLSLFFLNFILFFLFNWFLLFFIQLIFIAFIIAFYYYSSFFSYFFWISTFGFLPNLKIIEVHKISKFCCYFLNLNFLINLLKNTNLLGLCNAVQCKEF